MIVRCLLPSQAQPKERGLQGQALCLLSGGPAYRQQKVGRHGGPRPALSPLIRHVAKTEASSQIGLWLHRISVSRYQKSAFFVVHDRGRAGSRPGRRVTFLARTRNVTQRMRPDCLRPCASLRANLRHAIQSAVPPSSLRGFAAPLRQTAASQSTKQRCPAAALPAARTACRRHRHTGEFGRPARVMTKLASSPITNCGCGYQI